MNTVECPICRRGVPEKRMTRHHLRTRHKRKGDPHLVELICRECHSYIHRLFTNAELQDEDSPLNTIEGLLEHPDYAKAIKWVKKQDPRKHPKIHTSKKKGRRRRR